MNKNISDKFSPRIKRNSKIEEKIGNMVLCLFSYDDSRTVSLEHNGETYAFLFDYKTRLNNLYIEIRKRVKKRNQYPREGFENFSWNKANTIIGYLQKLKKQNYF